MKIAIYITFFILISITLTFTQTSLEGRVTYTSTDEPIPYVYISLYKQDVLVSGVKTGLNGKYLFSGIDPGTYDVEASHMGYTPQKQVGVIVKADQTNRLDFAISEGVLMDAIEVIEYKAPLLEIKNTSGSTITAEAIRSLPTKSIHDVAASPSGISSPHSGEIPMRSARSHTTTYYADGLRTTLPKAFKRSDLPESGQMTVGEWNDLHNWKDWLVLLENENYSIMKERYTIHPTDRYSVVVVNQENSVLANVPVQLLDREGKVIWKTFTDNSGRVELWENVFGKDQNATEIKVRNQIIKDIVKIEDGSNTIVLKEECYSPDKMDIVFVVDATSSMNDEITYLKSELLDVISRIKDANEDVDFNLGSVFYRDTNDEYLTRVSPLSSDHEEIINFVDNQNSNGGGDHPEAVETALEKTLQLSWRADALKMVFLILDAPPHEDDATMKKIRSQIKEAAARGIKLIPVTASGIGRNTEFLMKFMAILTNGTYVFITDDSGIGNPHLNPVVDDYEVEKLNDCLVRLIVQYSKSFSCDTEDEIKNEGIEINIFPNPSTQFINVNTNSIPDKIKIYSANGMMVKSINPIKKNTRIELGDFINGIYSISISFGQEVETRQIILLK